MVDDKNTEGFDLCLFKKLLYPFDLSEYSIHIKIFYDLPCLVFRKKTCILTQMLNMDNYLSHYIRKIWLN